MANKEKVYVCPKQLFELQAYKDATKPTKDKMVLYCWLVARHGGLDEEYTEIGYSTFMAFFPQQCLKGFRKSLKSIVDCDEVFSFRIPDRRQCLGYRFADDIRAEDFVEVKLVSFRGKKFAEKPVAPPQPQLIAPNLTLSVHEQLAKCMEMFTLNPEKVLPAISHLNLVERTVAEYQVERWTQKQFFCVLGETGRLYTSASGMKRELRPLLECRGESVCEIDVSCCQPVLLGHLVADKVSANEFKAYKELTESGKLYETIAADINQTRPLVKRMLMKWLCGSWCESRPPLKPNSTMSVKKQTERTVLGLIHDWFTVNFPEICGYLKSEKTNEVYRAQFQTKARGQKGQSTQPYAIISHKLQKLESQIVIETCCKALIDQDPAFPILTIHDGLVVPKSLGPTALTELKQSFSALGMSPKIAMKC